MIRKLSLPRIILAALLAVSILSVRPASARPGEPSAQFAVTVPTQVFPTGTIPLKRVIYIWTAVEGASSYELQVVQGSTAIIDQLVDAAACTAGTCSASPVVDLVTGSYSWRVRAVIGGVYQSFPAWQAFAVSITDPLAGFTSNFTSDMTGWVAHKGNWLLESSNYMTTLGVAGKAATVSHVNDYSTLAYEVRMKRVGCSGCANVLAIRGNPVLDSSGWWISEYTFDYTNTGLFSVWKDNNGTYTPLKDWTSTSTIVKGGWNTLKVTASGSTLKFYINGVLVWSGTDSSYASGRVGIGMYRSSTSTGDKLFVDWATLNTSILAPSASALEISPDESQVEVPGGDHNMAP